MQFKFWIFVVFLQLAATLSSNPPETHSQSHHLTLNNAHDYRTRSSSGAGDILSGFILGPILFFCSFICIWFNEKRAAIDSRRLKLAGDICEQVDVTSQQSAMSKDGRLVYATGESRTSAIIVDPLANVGGPNLIKVTRVVEVL